MRNISDYLFVLTSCIVWFVFLYMTIVKLIQSYTKQDQLEIVETSSDVSFYWFILIIGGIILTTLTYVSIRKYFGHKKVTKKRRSKD